MNKQEALEYLDKWEYENSIFEMISVIVGFDQRTIAPRLGSEYRNRRMADIYTKQFNHQQDPKFKDVIDFLFKEENLDVINKRKVEKYSKTINDNKNISSELFNEFSNTQLEAEDIWQQAKETNNYELFKPYLIKLINLTKQMVNTRHNEKSVYNNLLNDYEQGTSIEFYDHFFDLIKTELVPLIQKINQSKPIDTSFIHLNYPKDFQEKLMFRINDILGFDSSFGYMGQSMHPFSTSVCTNDVRVTTEYNEHDISSSIFSIIHEVGHSFYEHGVDPKYDGTIIKSGISYGMHESQSRLLENYLGRDIHLVSRFYPYLQELFPRQLSDVSLETFTKAINAAQCSLVRTDADELTYPIHILIRYEIEKQIFNDSVDYDHLEQTWNQLYKDYLGVDVDCASNGILQDIHWAGASFGYFPTYALGSAVAAQLMYKMRQEIDVDDALEHDFSKIIAWLKDKIHQYGGLYTMNELLLNATGEAFNPNYYINYLKDKYSKLYNLND